MKKNKKISASVVGIVASVIGIVASILVIILDLIDGESIGVGIGLLFFSILNLLINSRDNRKENKQK